MRTLTPKSGFTTVLLRIEDLGRRFAPDRWLFRDLNLGLAPGEQVALRGESGVGKSTLLHLIAGLDRPDEGKVFHDAVAISSMTEAQLLEFRRRRLGFVFQAFHLLPHLTALQNVSIPSLLAGASAEMAACRAREMLASLGMSHRADGLPGELSGGEQQRVALARALAHRPGLVLADEPTGNLDPHTARRALDSLCETCRECGAALLMVTHSPEAAGRLDRSLLLTADGLLESSPSR